MSIRIPLSHPAPAAAARKAPASLREWVQEARAAEEAQDWNRAVESWRRALEEAPFNTLVRGAYEECLEMAIRAEMRAIPRRTEAPARIEPAAEPRRIFDEPTAAPAPAAAPRIPMGNVRQAPRRRGTSAGTGWAIAAGVAIFLTAGGLIASAIASGLAGRLLASSTAPVEAAAPAIPEALTLKVKEAERLVATGSSSQAVEKLQAAARMFPDYEDAVLPVLGKAFAAQGERELKNRRFDKAIKAFEESTKSAPTATTSWTGLGRAFREQAKASKVPARQREILAKSEAAYRQALAVAPSDAAAMLGLAQTFDAKNERAKAADTYEKLLAMAPQSSESAIARTALKQMKKR
jgi:Tfp pilus assembly protein PilF